MLIRDRRRQGTNAGQAQNLAGTLSNNMEHFQANQTIEHWEPKGDRIPAIDQAMELSKLMPKGIARDRLLHTAAALWANCFAPLYVVRTQTKPKKEKKNR